MENTSLVCGMYIVERSFSLFCFFPSVCLSFVCPSVCMPFLSVFLCFFLSLVTFFPFFLSVCSSICLSFLSFLVFGFDCPFSPSFVSPFFLFVFF